MKVEDDNVREREVSTGRVRTRLCQVRVPRRELLLQTLLVPSIAEVLRNSETRPSKTAAGGELSMRGLVSTFLILPVAINVRLTPSW